MLEFWPKPDCFIELCAGSASVSLALIGGKKANPPAGYLGSKTRFAYEILNLMGLHPGQNTKSLILNDAGPWGNAWEFLPGNSREIAKLIRDWSQQYTDDKEMWGFCEHIFKTKVGLKKVSAFIWLQSRSLRNYPVNESTNLYGPQMPSGDPTDSYRGRRIPTTSGTIRKLIYLSTLHWPTVRAFRRSAENIPIIVSRGTYVYIDPPYKDTMGYGVALSRNLVEDIALRWSNAGAIVAISEREPIQINGWYHKPITGINPNGRTLTSDKAEWITINRLQER